jgi:CheY-like chemotaxis protein
MNVMIVEDDRYSRETLCQILELFGHSAVAAMNGREALRLFVKQKPDIIITDWLMPETDGIELCKRIRHDEEEDYTFIVMVSAKNRKEDMVQAMEAGVDDFMSKPFHREELRLRLTNAERILTLQRSLNSRIRDLEAAKAEVAQLQGFLPICAYCKNVRNDSDFWQGIEHYLGERSDQLIFSHCICPACQEKHVKPMEQKFYAPSQPPDSPH